MILLWGKVARCRIIQKPAERQVFGVLSCIILVMVNPKMKYLKRLLEKRASLVNQAFVGAVVMAVLVGVYVVVFSHASGSTIPVPAATGPGVPIPATGAYWGGITKDSVQGTTVPGCSGVEWPNTECKIQWAAQQQGLQPKLQSDSKYHTSMEHFFYPDCMTAKDADFKAGGRIYISAHTPGRKVILLDMKCGPTWSVLGNGGGQTTQDDRLKALTMLVDNVGVPVIWSIYNEPENDICGQNSNEGTPDDFRAMFRQAAADIRSQHPNNISIALTLQGYGLVVAAKLNTYETVFTSCSQSNLSAAQHNPNNFYPGDDAVDFVTAQEYDHDTGTFAGSYQIFYDWIHKACPTNHPSINYNCTTSARSVKPIGSSEWGISGDEAFRVKYFNDALVALRQFPQIKYLAYWDSQDNVKFPDVIDYPWPTADPNHPEYGTDTNHSSLKAYARWSMDSWVASPTYGSTIEGDVNGDGKVNVLDLSAVLAKWGTPDAAADLNHDGSVNVLDLSKLLGSWTG
jgi:hypothetical protein